MCCNYKVIKQVRILLMLFVLSLLVGCKDGLLTFSLKNNTEASIPPSTVLGGLLSQTSAANINSTSSFRNEGTSADLVKEIKLEELEVTILRPGDVTFSFLDFIEVYIADEDGENEQLIAEKRNIPNSVGVFIKLNTTGAELDEYIKAESFQILLKYNLDEVLTEDVDVDIFQRYSVKADPL
jgi:hypothetical protein